MRKKIEEDYTMFDEVEKDDELDDIIEEDIEEEDKEGDFYEEEEEMALTSVELKQEKAKELEDLQTLKTKMLTAKDKLAIKTSRIEELKETIKMMRTKNTIVIDPNIIEEAKEHDKDDDEESKGHVSEDEDDDLGADELDDDDEELLQALEEVGGENDDEGLDNGIAEVDPQVMKI